MTAGRSAGGVSAIGAVLSAVASSACCWLPLALMGFGLSAGGLSAWFEQYRFPFLIGSGVLLGVGFYSVYFAGRRCGSGCGCEARSTRANRFTKGMLWVSAVVVIAFAAFPKYAGALLVTSDNAIQHTSTDQAITFTIDGMTCEVCAVHLQGSLAKVAGVDHATVSYEGGTAELSLDPAAPFDPQAALNAIREAGYSGAISEIPAHSASDP